jgi:class 3 adenylate cyclase/CHASE2 domain-containing sensor protein
VSLRRHYRPLVLGGCALLGLVVTLAAGTPTLPDGPLLEVMIKARAVVTSSGTAPEDSPVAVVALDKRSLESDELMEVPRVLMVQVWANVLDALEQAGARVVGFDIIFAYSGNRFREDFDAPFLEALARNRARVVLARSEDTLPDVPFIAAVGANEQPDALAHVAVRPDGDGTVRRVQATDARTGLPGFAAAVVRRGGRGHFPPEVLLAPRRHLETIPTYAVVDVLRCAKRAPSALARVLRDKVVLIGGTLPEEDRKPAAGRLLAAPAADGPAVHACGLRRLGASAPAATNVPGVFVHAAAIDAALTRRLTSTLPTPIVAAGTATTAVIGAAVGLTVNPWLAALGVMALAAVLFAGATAALAADVWAPIALPAVALVASPAVAYAVRYLVVERTKRRLQHAFSHYLSPQVVQRLSMEGAELRLGGERREITIMFADLSGFTWLSSQLDPETLTHLTNQYLGYIVDAVEATGGYVDKFIGDAVMAIWGAPLNDADHAIHGVGAALAAATRVRAEGRRAASQGERRYWVKIGVNTGPAVIGNVGTASRYNYTAVGETVNVASRLESVPGLYGCQVVLSAATAELAREHFLLRELDVIQVRGREAPLAIYQPIAPLIDATPEQRDRVTRYAEALAYYRARRFADAARVWEGVAKEEEPVDSLETHATEQSPAAVMAARARALLSTPPPDTWSGVWTLASK